MITSDISGNHADCGGGGVFNGFPGFAECGERSAGVKQFIHPQQDEIPFFFLHPTINISATGIKNFITPANMKNRPTSD